MFNYLDIVAILPITKRFTAHMECCTFFFTFVDVAHYFVVLCLAVVWSLVGLIAELIADLYAASAANLCTSIAAR